MLVWRPFALQLGELGFHVFDKDTIALLMVGPFVVAILFFVGGILEDILAARAGEHSSRRSFLLIAVLPTFVAVVPGFPDSLWDHPLSGVSIFLVGVVLWGIYDRIERRFGT